MPLPDSETSTLEAGIGAAADVAGDVGAAWAEAAAAARGVAVLVTVTVAAGAAAAVTVTVDVGAGFDVLDLAVPIAVPVRSKTRPAAEAIKMLDTRGLRLWGGGAFWRAPGAGV